ncbi:hypothetical protein H4R34_001193 [Dimargaris verticillata]|uniref:Inositol-pentakisphosphate 2-kinase n=1 Tax=Dimargaris verticillata TaxID=2761393 RepID=A0A9W8B6N9_9FUNG|nr:hypothetical protein H4R34_001193 [Dimargaris verticillata]
MFHEPSHNWSPPAAIYDAALWKYKNEGNANVVFSAQRGQYSGLALRVRKQDKSGEPAPRDQALADSYVMGVSYIQRVIAPLLGSEYITPMYLVPVNAPFLADLNNQFTHDRPQERRDRGIDIHQNYAIVTVDLTYHPYTAYVAAQSHSPPTTSFSVELKRRHCGHYYMAWGVCELTRELLDYVSTLYLRHWQPKWGFLPSSPRLPAHSAKHTTCRFCMHKYLKAFDHIKRNPHSDVKDIALYCPLDLYSNDPARLQLAFRSLYKLPDNNMRLFDQQGHLAKRQEDALEAYLTPILVRVLRDEPLLNRLRFAQQQLDSWDIEVLAGHILNGAPHSDVPVSRANLLQEPTIDEWVKAIEAYLVRSSSAVDGTRPDAYQFPETEAELRQAVLEYLVSATLKDCSIFVSFWLDPLSAEEDPGLATASQYRMPSPTNPFHAIGDRSTSHLEVVVTKDGNLDVQGKGSPPLSPGDGTWFNLYYSVRAIDLDPKPISKFKRYYHMDRDIMQYYGSFKPHTMRLKQCSQP